MLATFVIGLREGLEAALIIGIIAAFLRQSNRPDALRKVWAGVGAAVLLCLAVGMSLQLLNTALPQREQEMLEGVVTAIAVVMVSYMVLWMRAHSRDLKGTLRTAAGSALASGSAGALVAMAFLAVIREGFETAVFLLAAFQSALSPAEAVAGVILGVGVATGLGYLVYRGGVTLNLSRFFRITGVVLVLVAGGLVMSTLRAAYEAGWLTAGQQPVLDLSAIARPGSVTESLLTGMLGIRSGLPVVEVVAYLLYMVPMLLVVLWPPRRTPSGPALGRVLVGAATGALVLAGLLLMSAPATPARVTTAQGPFVVSTAARTAATGSDAGNVTATVDASSAARVGADVSGALPGAGSFELVLTPTGTGPGGTTFIGEPSTRGVDAAAAGLPTSLTASQLAERNGGRLPVGVRSAGGTQVLGITYTDSLTPTLAVDAETGVVTAVELRLIRSMQVTVPGRSAAPAGAVAEATLIMTDAGLAAGRARIAAFEHDRVRQEVLGQVIPTLLAVFAVLLLAFGVPKLVRRGPTADDAPPAADPTDGPPTRTAPPEPGHPAITSAGSTPGEPIRPAPPQPVGSGIRPGR